MIRRNIRFLSTLSKTLAGIALLPPLLASFPIGAMLRLRSNRAHDRLMLACGICWGPILIPCLGVSWLIDKYTGEKKF